MSDIVERLGRRIHNQRARLRYWETLFNQHVHGHLHVLHPRHLKKAIELGNENFRLRQLLSEAETREREARVKALEEAALRVDAKANGYQVEARDVRRSERDRRFCASVADRLCGAAADIRALQSEER
ncbi:hypothetical protein [Agrobacterium salinitolerans]|uniref:hypothetical protein n=1 Tax=Agrobacterium salinitolerans TaxID=1183413 RepID=UPI001571FE79|nr:hypothetical protein [Agrobacterium salinitolerans]NTA36824.1 hypothetical protein [Agrobacterium salinitolerans]